MANVLNLPIPVPIVDGGTNNTTAYTSGGVIFSNGTALVQSATPSDFSFASGAFTVNSSVGSASMTVSTTLTGADADSIHSRGEGSGAARSIYSNAGSPQYYAGLLTGSTHYSIRDVLNNITVLDITSGSVPVVGIGTIIGASNFNVTGSTTPLVSLSTAATHSGTFINTHQILATGMATGDTAVMQIGAVISADNYAQFGFLNVGTGSTSNAATLGVAGTNLLTAAATGDVTVLTGNLVVNTLGKGIKIPTGANSRMNTATLAAGTVTVSNTTVTTSTFIFLSRTVLGGTAGSLSISAQSAGSFTMHSSSGLDTSTIAYLLIEP
jgi:hypothetical protein